METIYLLWKILLILHLVSNALFFGISFVFAYGNHILLKEELVRRYTKISSLLIAISGLSGIGLLSILSMEGMDDLTASGVGQSILVMILGYVVVLFVFVLALIYKGGEEKIYKRLFSIMFFIYLFVFLSRGFLI